MNFFPFYLYLCVSLFPDLFIICCTFASLHRFAKFALFGHYFSFVWFLSYKILPKIYFLIFFSLFISFTIVSLSFLFPLAAVVGVQLVVLVLFQAGFKKEYVTTASFIFIYLWEIYFVFLIFSLHLVSTWMLHFSNFSSFFIVRLCSNAVTVVFLLLFISFFFTDIRLYSHCCVQVADLLLPSTSYFR